MNIIKTTSNYRFKLMVTAYDKWLKKDASVLDVGCGRGTITKLLADRYKLKMTACDIKNYLLYDIPFVKIKNGKLPKFKNKFDFLFLNDVLHHVPKEQQKQILNASASISNKILIFEFKPTFIGSIMDVVLNKFHYGDLFTPLSFRNVSEWINLFNKLNFDYKIQTLPRPFWYPFSHIAMLLQKAGRKK